MSLQITMRTLSDPSRREILNLLKEDPMTATSIAEHFDMSAPAVSKHLNILKEAELVRCRREGKFQIYELNASVLEEVLLWIKDIKEGTK